MPWRPSLARTLEGYKDHFTSTADGLVLSALQPSDPSDARDALPLETLFASQLTQL